MLRPALFTLLALTAASPAVAREMVDASAPSDLAVTIYRDPDRGAFEAMDPAWPQGFAMISETRTVTLPPGESTIRFTGVAEGMVAVSAIVTGLPGGVIEKNRDAQLLSPAALVDGTLGNRVTITRTHPATGRETSESAVIRTRADGGLVLQTQAGFEAVRCSGLPERLTFDRVPGGLSPAPVFSVNTHDPAGGTYQVTLTYLAAGFDWQAQYVAQLEESAPGEDRKLHLQAWLTLANDNGQSFDNAELLVVAGRLNVESDYRDLSDPPVAAPLRLTCFPFGSTAAGTPVPDYAYPPPPMPMSAPPELMMSAEMVTVTGARLMASDLAKLPQFIATEENLGDLKLYRVPQRVSVAARGQKQVAFLQQDGVTGAFVYELDCFAASLGEAEPLGITFTTRNDKAHGLGMALPSGQMALFEPSSFGPQLVGEPHLRDYGREQEVELDVGTSHQVQGACNFAHVPDDWRKARNWADVEARITNANPEAVTVRVWLGAPDDWEYRKRPRGTSLKDGRLMVELRVPANAASTASWQIRPPPGGG